MIIAISLEGRHGCKLSACLIRRLPFAKATRRDRHQKAKGLRPREIAARDNGLLVFGNRTFHGEQHYCARPGSQVRNGLSGGGKGIRTIGPALTTGSRLLPKGDTGPISRMGAFKHGSRETTTVGRGSPSLHGRLFHGRDRWFESVFLHRRVRCEPDSLVAHNARHIMLLTVKSAAAEDEQAVVALWRACDLAASYNDPVADFRFATAGQPSGRPALLRSSGSRARRIVR